MVLIFSRPSVAASWSHHDDGDVRRGGISLERGEHGPAIHAGHHHVEGDDGGLEFFGQCETAMPVGGGDDVIAVFGEAALHEVPDVGVVINDEDGRGGGMRLLGGMGLMGSIRSVGVIRDSHRQRDGERGALARLAFHGDGAAHELAELPADGEAETGAAELPGRGGIHLREGFEQPGHLLRGHADAGVADGEGDQWTVISNQCWSF